MRVLAKWPSLSLWSTSKFHLWEKPLPALVGKNCRYKFGRAGAGMRLWGYYLPGDSPVPPPEHQAHGSPTNPERGQINLTIYYVHYVHHAGVTFWSSTCFESSNIKSSHSTITLETTFGPSKISSHQQLFKSSNSSCSLEEKEIRMFFCQII